MRPSTDHSGCGLFVLWSLLFILFWSFIQAGANLTSALDLGYPLWLLIAQLIIFGGLIVSLVGLLGRRKWGAYGLFSSAVLMIPTSVAYNYFYLNITEGLVLTAAWVARNTIITAVMIMVGVTVIFWSMRTNKKK